MITDRVGRRASAGLAFLAALLIAMTAPAAAAGPGLTFSSEKAPNPDVVEDTLTVSEHDRGDMSSPIQYYNDNGSVAKLPATVNQSQDTPVGVRMDKVSADAYNLFPRIDGEADNDATWTKSSGWTTTTSDSTNVSPSLTDADADGVQKISFSTSGMGSGDTATATFSNNVSITSDANKRVLMVAGNVDTLSSGATIEVRAVDSDGDYRYAEVNPSKAANANDVIASGTGNGFVFQQRLSDLTLAGSGDGTFSEIQKVEIVVADADAGMTIAGLDLDKKSTFNVGEIQRDTDGDGDLEETLVTDIYTSGVTDFTSLSTMGSEFDTAQLMDLKVYNVRYQYSDLTDSAESSVEFSSADDYSYSQKLEAYGDLEVPSAIDLSHGTLTLEFDQGLPNERYVTYEVAENVDTTTDFGNVSDSSYSDVTGSLGSKGDTATLDSTVSADQNYRVHMVVLLQDDEVDTLQTTGAVGPTDTSSDGFFSTLWGQISGVVGAVLGAVGLKRKVGGS